MDIVILVCVESKFAHMDMTYVVLHRTTLPGRDSFVLSVLRGVICRGIKFLSGEGGADRTDHVAEPSCSLARSYLTWLHLCR